MIIIENSQIYSSDGKFIHRLDSESYFKRATTIVGDTPDLFEEVDEIPRYTEAEYNKKVAELVAGRYSAADEAALHRKMINAQMAGTSPSEKLAAEYALYNSFVDQCKVSAVEILSAKPDDLSQI